MYHKAETKIKITHLHPCESFRLGNFHCLSYDEKFKIHRGRETKLKKFKTVVWLGEVLPSVRNTDLQFLPPRVNSVFFHTKCKWVDRSFLPLCMHARVHKLYVLIQAFMLISNDKAILLFFSFWASKS